MWRHLIVGGVSNFVIVEFLNSFLSDIVYTFANIHKMNLNICAFSNLEIFASNVVAFFKDLSAYKILL